MGEARRFTPGRGGFSTKLTSPWSEGEAGAHRDYPHEEIEPPAPVSYLLPVIQDDRIGLNQRGLALPRRAVRGKVLSWLWSAALTWEI